MEENQAIKNKCYSIGKHEYSIHDVLLMPFSRAFLTDLGFPRVSDFHFKSGQPLRMRVDGELEPVPEASILDDTMIRNLLYPLLVDSQIREFESDPLKDIDTSYQLEGLDYNFRINLFRERTGLAAVIRLLNEHILPIDEIGITNRKIIEQLTAMRFGLLVISGVTSSGKSTTVASLLQHFLNSRNCRIITLEDPIEYIFRNSAGMVSQREVGKHFASFPEGLRSAMRENPDIIFVGEMRDAHTIRLALNAANTGHLVLSTVHAGSASGTLLRLVNAFPSEQVNEVKAMLSLSLCGLLCQKLVPRNDFRGVLPAVEFLHKTKAVENILRQGKYDQLYSVMETSYKDGMQTMDRALNDLYENNRITLETVKNHSINLQFTD